MGVDENTLRCLLYAKSVGANFDSVLTIGHQELHLSPSQLRKALADFGILVSGRDVDEIFYSSGRYADAVFPFLAAKKVDALDKSDYEGATILHDLNLEMPSYLSGAYSMVFDGGALEHVYNFPLAVRSCMKMVRRGGAYLAVSPGNNFMGHGFYQVSPEFYRAVLNEENGYSNLSLFAFESGSEPRFYRVEFPQSPQDRVMLVNARPVLLFAMAVRSNIVTSVEFFSHQRDYVSAWSASSRSGKPGSEWERGFIRNLFRLVPLELRWMLKYLFSSGVGYDARYFHRTQLHLEAKKRTALPMKN